MHALASAEQALIQPPQLPYQQAEEEPPSVTTPAGVMEPTPMEWSMDRGLAIDAIAARWPDGCPGAAGWPAWHGAQGTGAKGAASEPQTVPSGGSKAETKMAVS